MNNNNNIEVKRSRNSNKHSYVRFFNKTHRKVDVIWINYEGVRVKYKSLAPKEHFDVTSFVGHPWLFRDSETQTNLVVNSREVFDCPEPIFIPLKNGEIRQTRSIVMITLPLFSLHECSIQAIQRSITDPQDAFKLEIPAPLQREIYKRCVMRRGNRISNTIFNSNNNVNEEHNSNNANSNE